MVEAALVEVGADAEQDQGGRGRVRAGGRARGVQHLDERTPDRLVRAERERLLELVDDPHGPGGGGLALSPRGDRFPEGVREFGRMVEVGTAGPGAGDDRSQPGYSTGQF